MEKLIHEMRMIETDDGYRIEIKGDKEKMKKFFSELKKHGREHHRGQRHGGHGYFPPWMWMKMASCHGPWDFEIDEEESEEAAKA
jgi:hypothetical protein